MDNFFTTILIFFIIDSREKNNKSILDMAKCQTGQNFLIRPDSSPIFLLEAKTS